MPSTLARQRPSLGDAFQSSKMVTLLNSFFFVFSISYDLPNCCVKYYNYIVKSCSGVACNWCLLLDKIINNIKIYIIHPVYKYIYIYIYQGS